MADAGAGDAEDDDFDRLAARRAGVDYEEVKGRGNKT